jgi:hypothetical protein
MFEEVLCPEEGCNFVMNPETEFYGNLPEEIRKQYLKAHQFYMTANDPTLKLCPKEDCEGVIKITENEARVCDQCKR